MSEHIVKSFERELGQLDSLLEEMGRRASGQLASSLASLLERSSALAEQTVAADVKLDLLERDVAHAALQMLALRQPVADDLRHTIASIRAAGDLERIGDLAKGIAKRSIVLSRLPQSPSVQGLARAGDQVADRIRRVVRAYLDRDTACARAVWSGDQEIDDWNHAYFRELLTYMMEDPRTITVCTHLLFVAKNIERIGDHCTHIASSICYLVEGDDLAQARPKGADAADVGAA